MLSANLSSRIEFPWTAMQPLSLGSVPAGFSTADLFVTITDEQRPFMRIDIYRDSRTEAIAFQDVIIWSERVFVGYGHRVYMIDPAMRIGSDIFLGSGSAYFGAFYTGMDYLLVASGESLLRLSPDGKVLWTTSHLALDGVIVNSVGNEVIQGEGEWDPPEGSKPFALHLDSGELIADNGQF